MPTTRRHVVILSCLVAAVSVFGCAPAPDTVSQTNNSNASPFKATNPATPPSPDRQLLEVAVASGFKEEPDDPAAALSLIDAGANVNARAPASPS